MLHIWIHLGGKVLVNSFQPSFFSSTRSPFLAFCWLNEGSLERMEAFTHPIGTEWTSGRGVRRPRPWVCPCFCCSRTCCCLTRDGLLRDAQLPSMNEDARLSRLISIPEGRVGISQSHASLPDKRDNGTTIWSPNSKGAGRMWTRFGALCRREGIPGP